jgi:hypothetical protein
MQKPTVNVPLTLSYDTRGVLSFTNMAAGKDQRRLNCQYEITRLAVDSTQDIAVSRRPGFTADGGTYGAGTQVNYLVARDPASTWNQTPWVLVKDSNDNKAVSSSTATTILSSADYYPRFWEVTDVNGTNTLVVQLQNSASPSATPAQKVYYSTAIATFTEISDADFTALSHRGKMVFMDGYAFIMDSRNRIYQSNINSLSAWTSTDYLTKSTTLDSPQGLAKIKNIILGFGTDTVELFQNEGNATGSVLSRVAKSEHRIGLAAVAGGGATMAGKTDYYCAIGDFIFFMGRYGGSKNDASLIAFNGSRFEKISKPFEDGLFSSTPIYGIHRISMHGKVGVGIQFTAPSTAAQHWWIYYPDINEGFEYLGTVSLVNNGLNYAGATTTTKLYEFAAANTYRDDSTSFDMIVQFKLPFGDLQWKSMSCFGLIADTTSTTQNVAVSFSFDNGANWSTGRNINLAASKKELYRCGTFRECMVRLTHAGDGEIRLRRAYAYVQ